MKRAAIGCVLISAVLWAASAHAACGDIVTLPTHGGTTTRYSLARPSAPADPIALVLLAGGGGFLDLDDDGCARAMKGNSLVRMATLFRDAGFVTALVDAPSDHRGDDGLADFRTAQEHAEDLGKMVADLRSKTKGRVWLVGPSRGTISAANAAARLSGEGAPDGVVLTSAVTSPDLRARKAFVRQSVFDADLSRIRMPFLIVGHAADACARSPASLMRDAMSRVRSERKQEVTLTGGPGRALGKSDVCEGRSPHGFIEQEAEVVAGIARFVRGEKY